jgi:ferredoxin
MNSETTVELTRIGHLADGVHVERFTGCRPSDDVENDYRPFELVLARTGVTVEVPADRSTLEVVRQVLPDYPFGCTEGYCGSCEAAVLSGEPDHRHTILTVVERETGATMMICVGRAKGSRLELDI